ncbi:MAG: methyl-accepting chemotaxis protein [Desulfamplus sp.]|nr:methyl-accepting chemotaxis protein [Desulfamplus sp.]
MKYIKGLRGKLLLSICSILFLSLVCSISIISIKGFKSSKNEAMKFTFAKADYFGSKINNELGRALETARSLALGFAGLKKQTKSPDREILHSMLREVVEQSPQYLGAWTVWEPNALDGKDAEYVNKEGHDATGRFIPYWNRVGGIHIEPCSNYDDNTTTGYYTKPKSKGKEVVMEPIAYDIGGKMVTVISVCVPIKIDGKVVGVTGVDFSMDKMREMISDVKVYESGYGSLISNSGIIIAHPVEAMVGKDIKEFVSPETLQNITDAKESSEIFVSVKTKTESQFVFTPIHIGNTGISWSMAISGPVDEILLCAKNQRDISIGIGIVTLIILSFSVYFIAGRIIVNPVKQVVNSLNDIAQGEGDTTKRLEITSQDELGELAKAFNLFMDKLQRLITMIFENAKTLDGSSKSLVGLAKVLSSDSSDASEKSTGVAAATEEMNANINAVASAMEEASNNINMVATATEEMSATINEIAKNSENARGISAQAVKKADNAKNSMSELGRAAMEIGKVTEVINDISEQTNLLALNATIEAARAGEAGKGFAVVASEIKTLATQTVDATKEIKKKIEDVQSIANGSVADIQGFAKVIEDVNLLVVTIASAVEEQSIATSEISGNIANVSNSISEVGENMSQLSKASSHISQDINHVNISATDITTNSKRVNDNALNLSDLADKLKEIVGTFKI